MNFKSKGLFHSIVVIGASLAASCSSGGAPADAGLRDAAVPADALAVADGGPDAMADEGIDGGADAASPDLGKTDAIVIIL